MTEAPPCAGCRHYHANSDRCQRPVPSYWNAAANQRRSRLWTSAAAERVDGKTLTRRWRCGVAGHYFEPAVAPIGAESSAA